MAQKFAPAIQVFKTATTVTQIINETAIIQCELHKHATANPTEFANWHDYADSLAKHRLFFAACCNTFRRKRLIEHEDLWTSRTGNVIEKLTVDMFRLISVTWKSIEIAFETGQEGALQPLGMYRRKFIVLVVLLLTLEIVRYLSSLQNVLRQHYPGNLDHKAIQQFLFWEVLNPFRVMHDTIEEGLLCLHSMDGSWETVGFKFYKWATGQFDEPLTLNYILPRDISPDIAQGLQRELGQILFFIGPFPAASVGGTY